MADLGVLRIADNIVIESKYLTAKASRSSGPGGQNVNKVNSKAEIHFDFANCDTLTDEVRARLAEIARNRLDTDGKILISSQKTRSLHANMADACEKLKNLILKAMFIPEPRRATKPSFSSNLKRIEQKRRRGAAKRVRHERKNVRYDD
ncbi:alternative ribosome rescue aminoacyl-tRNA hydrolase ArfB [Ignavibacteria bacterium]|jgi:ribosome-associated protein|nr:aminoacyl-tRNA hydrolase [Bacteroidota bacterium]MCZ2132792.1 aminoacyl-tRNA hydrolase [Bacteroidota bacterium]